MGCNTKSLTLFLWFVNVQIDFPAAKSHNLIVESWDPVITCGSDACVMTDETVCVCPVKVCMFALVRISQTLAVESRPAVSKTSIVGCSAKE